MFQSRKTGYKILARYKDCGLDGLTDRSRRPYRQANKLPFQLETLIVQLKQEKPNWGAPKIREKIRRRYDGIHLPAISTVHAVLDRHGLVDKSRRPRHKANGTQLSRPRDPNDLWCADYKGEFMLADRRYCYPLTVTDFASRFAGQNVGIKQVGDRIWLVSFMQYDLGYFDHETVRIESARNPFEAKVLPMSPE